MTEGYRSATTGVALMDRDDLRYWRFTGRDPVRMLDGVVSGRMPELPKTQGLVQIGEATPQTVLTPKGRMIADLRLAREAGPADEADRLWAVVPAAATEGLRAHLTRYLPPRFAKVEEPEGVAILGVIGPDSDALISRVLLGLLVETETLSKLPTGGTVVVHDETVPEDDADVPTRLVRCGETGIPAWQVIGPEEEVAAARRALEAAGAVPATADDWTVLRVEAGTPAYGADMDESTIPTEAGLDQVAIDHGKGCYTGQEVIVRIRDRGHVNRRLLRVPLGDIDPPANGTELFVEGREKPAAVLRSAARSPRFGETIGLAYVRREVWTGEGEPPEFVLRG
jgi:folate-binding protein YgfZ